MKRTKSVPRLVQSVIVLAAALLSLASGPATVADEMQHLSIRLPGGMPGLPTMGPIQAVSNGISVTWFGPAGYYQLLEKTNIGGVWRKLGGLRLTNQAILSSNHAGSFFSVSGPNAKYAGSRACLECHPGPHAASLSSAHGGAYTNAMFASLGGQTNQTCLACHSVGYGLPTGFTVTNRNGAWTYSAHLAGVQCENCHGPAGRHAANPNDFTVRPRVEIAATVCGGCHTSQSVPAGVTNIHPAIYDDWNTSKHNVVTPDVAASLAVGTTNTIASCGRCHSGTVRQALLSNGPLPGGHEAGAIGVACATCHDPHAIHTYTNVLAGVVAFTNRLTGYSYLITNNTVGAVYTNQLLAPFASLHDFRATGSFATNHDASVNGCGQCHNDRGASYLTTRFPPHHSPQYNFLLGTVGEMLDEARPNFPSAHSRIEKQCTGCHLQTASGDSGHKFRLTSFEMCADCHGTAGNAQGFAGLLSGIITSLRDDVKASLDQWGATQSPVAIRSYGALAWEYENAGQLSSVDGTAHGPTAAEQANIPDNIKKARFNLYLVANDGSLGVHNGPLAISLLLAAQSWLDEVTDE